MSELPSFEQLIIEEQDGVLICTINRPEVYNAMNYTMWHEMLLFARYFATEDHIKAAVITGAGKKAFAAGADISCVQYLTMLEGIGKNELAQAIDVWSSCGKPIIAAVNGLALGGGMELALSCDTRLASENAVFGLPELTLGVIPGAGGTQRLTRICGIGIAKDVLMFGRQLKAQEALNANLVMKVLPQEELLPEAIKLAQTVAKTRGIVAMSLCKQAINYGSEIDLKAALYLENLCFGITMGTEDKKEGMSAFLEKRKARFSGK